MAQIAAATGASDALAHLWGPAINAAMPRWGIVSRAHQAAFLAQVGHETLSLIYSEEIASGAAYEGRADLGNTQPGDGRRYKGRGLLQTTGRANYRDATAGIRRVMPECPDFEASPDLLARAPWAVHSACYYWHSRNLGRWVDAGDFVTLTRRINGGINGLADRQARWAKARAALGVA